MERITGTNLLETFHKLGVNTANVSKLTIDAWFETDCEETRDILHWLCKYLDEENVLTAHENEGYEQALNVRAFPNGNKYQAALTDLQKEHPGILDYHENILDVEYMEEELMMLKERESQLERALQIQQTLYKELKKETNEILEDEISSSVNMASAKASCLKLAYELDKKHEKLQQQILRYGDHLNEFDCAVPPTFFSSIPTVEYYENYSTVTSYLDLLIRREHELLPKLEYTVTSVRKHMQNGVSSIEGASSQLDVLRNRIFNAIKKNFRAQVKEKQLKAKIRFSEDLLLNVAKSTPTDQRFLLEANIRSKEELLELASLKMNNIAAVVCDGFVKAPNMKFAQKQKNLKSLIAMDKKFKQMLLNHMIIYFLLGKEQFDIEGTDKFFRDVHYYIGHELRICQLRTDTMLNMINEYHSVYKKLPIEEQFKIINTIKVLLTNDKKSEITTKDAISKFNTELKILEQEIFINDDVTFLHFSRNKERELTRLQKCLMKGPSRQIITISPELVNGFVKVQDLLDTQGKLIQSVLLNIKDVQKKISSNQWLKLKRNLWLYFLFDPKKVLNAIDQIESFVNPAKK